MTDPGRLLKSIAVFALPVVLAKVAALFIGTGPADVIAVVPVDTAPTEVPRLDVARTWTSAQKAAAAHAALLATQPMGESPLLHGPMDNRRDDPPPPTPPTSAPRAALQMILDAGPDSVAYFDGKRYRLGDALLGTTWVLVEISSVNRSVTVQNGEAGEKHTYHLSGGGR